MFRKSKKPSADASIVDLLSESIKAAPDESELELKFAALWKLLQDKLELTDEDLTTHIEKIKNERTAKRSESAETNIQKCPKCARTVSVKTGLCLYCGKEE